MTNAADSPSKPLRPKGDIRLNVYGMTDVGQIREHNEDNFLVADLTRQSRRVEQEDEQSLGERGAVLGVCDGMGGAAAGEVASQLAVDIIYEKLLEGPPPPSRDDLARQLVQTVEEAGIRIFNEARADRTRRGMGTTATIAALIDERLFLAQVGDSRGYILRDDELIQVTRDQSLVNQLIEAGQLTEEEAETFEHNNIILQALGTADTVQVDLTYVDLHRGDTLLLCSDGLSGMIRMDEIREVLLNVHDPREACQALTERANMAGGHDNVTVIVARFEGQGLPQGVSDDPALAYQKYALPQSDADATARAAPVEPDEQPVFSIPPPTEKDSDLKVAHPVAEMGSPLNEAATSSAADEGRSAGPAARQLGSSRAYGLDDEPVSIPTTGLPPSIVGFMVLAAMVLVAVTGFFLLR